MSDKKNSLSKNLQKLSEISEWFESREEIDVEKGLEKVREASLLIREGKKRLKEIENEFEEIKREMDDNLEDTSEEN